MYACNYFDMKNFGMGVYKKHPDNCTADAKEFVHAVAVIGFGMNEKNESYWEVKNSYSS